MHYFMVFVLSVYNLSYGSQLNAKRKIIVYHVVHVRSIDESMLLYLPFYCARHDNNKEMKMFQLFRY